MLGIAAGFHLAYYVADDDADTPGPPRKTRTKMASRDLRSSIWGNLSSRIKRGFHKKSDARLHEKIHMQGGMSNAEFSCLDTEEDHDKKLAYAMDKQGESYSYIAARKAEDIE